MNINVHIERLILDGLPVKGSDGSIVQAAVETNCRVCLLNNV